MRSRRKPLTRQVDVPCSDRLTVRELALLISALDEARNRVFAVSSGPQKRMYNRALEKLRKWEEVDYRRRFPSQLFKRSNDSETDRS